MGKMALLMRKSWKEELHPRDGGGQFAHAPDTGMNPPAGNGTAHLAELKDAIRHDLENMAVPRLKVDYTEENFKKLFGEWNRVDTPAGRVTVPHSQFEKLEKENRKGWLGAMYQTITDPVLVIQESPERKLYVKAFTPEKKGVITFLSVVIEKDKSQVNITNHEKDMANVLNKIKKADAVVYKKPATIGGGSLTIGKSLRGVLPAGGEAEYSTSRLSTVLPKTPEMSSADWLIKRLNYRIAKSNLKSAIRRFEGGCA